MAHGESLVQLRFLHNHKPNKLFAVRLVLFQLEVSNEGKFVILEVDGLSGLEVGMQSKQTQEVLFGELRLALGGILISKDKLIVQVLKLDLLGKNQSCTNLVPYWCF